MRRIFVALVVLLAAGSPILAEEEENWGRSMFDHTSFNFGIVVRGQDAEHRFPLENIYLEDVCIEAVRSSCTCIVPKVTRNRLKTREKGEIVAVVDTRQFLGRKEATFRVSLSCQTPKGLSRNEVQLHSYVYIRSDVVLEPGAVRFGSVPYGTGAPGKKVAINYAGQSDWKIVRAECENPHIEWKLVETGRQVGEVSTKVSYDLLVGLKADAPVGYLRDHVMLITNDRDEKATRVAVPVEGAVVSTISAKPSPLMLGVVNPGQEVPKTLIVRGQKAFRIQDVSAPGGQFRFEVHDEAKTLHVIPVLFTAGDVPGTVDGEILIRTDSPGSELIQVKFHGRVVAPDIQAPDESP
jgi:hypothetical protein